jgi:hypothetical protein
VIKEYHLDRHLSRQNSFSMTEVSLILSGLITTSVGLGCRGRARNVALQMGSIICFATYLALRPSSLGPSHKKYLEEGLVSGSICFVYSYLTTPHSTLGSSIFVFSVSALLIIKSSSKWRISRYKYQCILYLAFDHLLTYI